MKDLGEISWFLGIQFVIENKCIKMNQSKYIEKLLSKYKMTDCKPRCTPCELGMNKICDEQAEMTDSRLYREIIGSLIYVMISTRPDLCFIVTKLSQYMSKPTVTHLAMAKHVLRYLKGTMYQNLTFTKSENSLNIVGFCDADWANSNDRRSISGYCFTLNEDGGLISWRSKKQQTVALSTCEAEYMSLTIAVQESKFLLKLLHSMLGYDLFPFITLHCDNQGALALAKNPVQHQRSKHIDIKYHFIRHEVQSGTLNLVYVPTDQNLSDIFTKPLSGVKFKSFVCNLMGIT